MAKITKYILVVSEQPNAGEKLVSSVNSRLEDGWKLQGGVAINTEGTFHQAMSKEVPKPKKQEEPAEQ